jgi:hypothetical protein
MASIYFKFPDTVYRLTDLGDILKTGANLEKDKITSKSSATEYNYPQTREYLDSHRYNPIGNYVTETNNRTSGWEALKQNISEQHVVLLLIDTYSNLHDTPSSVMLPEPTGSPVIGHFVAAIGYNESLDQVYFLNSWGNNYTKIGGISKNYWMVGPKSKYLVPYNITIDEVLVPMGITNLNNSTANCTNISFSWNNPLHTDFSHTYTLKNNVWVGNYSNTTTSVLWEGLPEGTAITFSAKTADLSGNMNPT